MISLDGEQIQTVFYSRTNTGYTQTHVAPHTIIVFIIFYCYPGYVLYGFDRHTSFMMNTKTKVDICYTSIHEGARSTKRRNTISRNLANDALVLWWPFLALLKLCYQRVGLLSGG